MWDFDSNPITGYDDSKTFGENLSIIEGKIIPLIIYFITQIKVLISLGLVPISYKTCSTFLMTNNTLKLFVLLSIVISCNKTLPGEHTSLAFENNSSNTVYVSKGILNKGLDDYGSKQVHIGLPKVKCEVAPNSINYDTAPIYGSGVSYSYENIFSRTKVAERCLVYVVPFYSTETLGTYEPLYDFKLVCYELTFNDLVSLNFHLYYPPNEKMKHIKMDPPYSSFTDEIQE